MSDFSVLPGSGLVSPTLPTAKEVQSAVWTCDPAMAPSTFTPVAGTLYFHRAYIDSAQPISTGWASCVSAGATPANCYLGMYDIVSGLLLCSTTDLSSYLTTVQVVPTPFAANLAGGGAYTGHWVEQEVLLCWLTGSAGTLPGFAGTRANGGNIGMTSDYRIQVKSGSYTSLPGTVPTGLTLPGSGSYGSFGFR
jgi:hypothetical protein